MRMGWWIFMLLAAVQVIVMQYMLEHYLGGHDVMSYVYALAFIAVSTWLAYYVYGKLKAAKE